VTYSLVSGLNDDAAAFTIDPALGKVTINAIPDYETRSSYSFTVEASDDFGKFTTKTVTLAINDRPPVIGSPATAHVNEGVAIGTPVYTATAADPAGGTITWSLVPGLSDDATSFSIDANGVVKINATPDYETKPSYSFTVQASDASGHATTQIVTLSVNDLAPVISSGAVAPAINDRRRGPYRGLYRGRGRSRRRVGAIFAGVQPRFDGVQHRCVERHRYPQRGAEFPD
jgi:hypothetical protein